MLGSRVCGCATGLGLAALTVVLTRQQASFQTLFRIAAANRSIGAVPHTLAVAGGRGALPKCAGSQAGGARYLFAYPHVPKTGGTTLSMQLLLAGGLASVVPGSAVSGGFNLTLFRVVSSGMSCQALGQLKFMFGHGLYRRAINIVSDTLSAQVRFIILVRDPHVHVPSAWREGKFQMRRYDTLDDWLKQHTDSHSLQASELSRSLYGSRAINDMLRFIDRVSEDERIAWIGSGDLGLDSWCQLSYITGVRFPVDTIKSRFRMRRPVNAETPSTFHLMSTAMEEEIMFYERLSELGRTLGRNIVGDMECWKMNFGCLSQPGAPHHDQVQQLLQDHFDSQLKSAKLRWNQSCPSVAR
eukprot:TRINITY_DN29555_c0_g1_i1.p1 TRINITY_DN29555_c0_g1~~TRINITY_DN29555_c0_g1_i1.p1  ORF type:complete len:356 (+),score=13.19 TRINITY_DN29555_c0_g1_i1:47-1114(+)